MSEITATSRAKRFERRPTPVPFELTRRDLNILGHVAHHRFLSSEHLARLDGGSEQNVLRILRILFDHQYLDRPHTQLAHVPVSGPRPMVYGLGRRGAQSLRDHSVHADASDWTERNKRAGAKFIEHTLAIADFMVGLEIACRERGDIKLLYERDILANAAERTQKSREPLRLVVPGLSNKMGVSSVIADGLFGLVFPDETAAYFLLEVDRGSMPVVRSNFERTSFNRKLLIYWEAWKKKLHVEQFGVSQIRVLTVTDSAKRVENMLRAVDEITEGKGSNFFLFGNQAPLPGSIFETAFLSGKRERISLID
jgi:protein involved in plasmid replication-relaxation